MTQVNLDSSLRAAAEAGTPVRVIDPETHRVYYLVSAEQFQKMESLVSGDFDPRQAYPLIDTVMAQDDANDPLLDSYQ